jgi:hypothetical protein
MTSLKPNKAKHCRFARTRFTRPCLRRYGDLVMLKNILIILMLNIFLLGCSEKEYKCFHNPEYPNEMLCYDHLKYQSMNASATEAAIKLFENISAPEDLIKAEGKLASFYTPEILSKYITEGYSGKSKDDIFDVLSTKDYSAVYLKGGETLYFEHSESVFVFSFESPKALVGTERYFGLYKPTVKILSIDNSLCNIDAGDIVFISPNKESQFISNSKTYCSYHGMAFVKDDKKIYTWPMLKEDGSWNTGNDYSYFSDFLYWLKYNHNKSSNTEAASSPGS